MKAGPGIRAVYQMYRDGFREMTLGKKLWLIIGIKLAIMFLLLRLFFFPDYLKSRFGSEQEKGNYVIEQLIKRK